jgi:hypothetical protein
MLKQQTAVVNDTCPTEADALPSANSHSLRKEKKKIVRRRSGDSNDSNESRRSLNSTSKKIADYATENHYYTKAIIGSSETLEMTPKPRADRQSKELLREGYTFVRLNHSATLKKAAIDTSDYLREHSMNKLPECMHQQNCISKISYLEE